MASCGATTPKRDPPAPLLRSRPVASDQPREKSDDIEYYPGGRCRNIRTVVLQLWLLVSVRTLSLWSQVH